jgi:hypothetical protein
MTQTTIRQQLTLMRQQNNEIIRLLAIIARHQQSTGCGCLPPNVQFPPDLPQIPLLPPELPDTPYVPGGDPILCRRIQKEIDNILTVWEQMIDIAQIAGIVSVAALAALIGSALAPETGGLSAVGLAALSAGLSALIAEAGGEIGDVPQPTRERAAKAAYNARSGGAASASSAALQVLRDEQPVLITAGAFVAFWTLWGGLRRAFDANANIGDWMHYPEICSNCYGHVDYVDIGSGMVERIYRWTSPVVMMNSIPGTQYNAGNLAYFRVPDNTTFKNESNHVIRLLVWNYSGVLYINRSVAAGESVVLPTVNGGYVCTSPTVTCPPGTLKFCIP